MFLNNGDFKNARVYIFKLVVWRGQATKSI